MRSFSAYELVVKKYGLAEILAGGDLQVTKSGDIALTPDGDLKFGNDRRNAMHRLVQRWCFNTRIFETLFSLVVEEGQRKQEAEREHEAVAAIIFTQSGMSEKFHALGEDIGAGEVGAAACAGAIMVALNNLLQRYKNDLIAINPRWKAVGPQFSGHSFGEVVDAAANNFRHHDEWARTRNPTSQQKKSIDVIVAVLNYSVMSPSFVVPWRRNASADLVLVVGGSDFTTLEESFFAFAKAMIPE